MWFLANTRQVQGLPLKERLVWLDKELESAEYGTLYVFNQYLKDLPRVGMPVSVFTRLIASGELILFEVTGGK